jgi:hypothetical protein
VVSAAAKGRCAVVCAAEKTRTAGLGSSGRLGFRPSNSGCLHLRLYCSRYLACECLQSLKSVSEAFPFHVTSSCLPRKNQYALSVFSGGGRSAEGAGTSDSAHAAEARSFALRYPKLGENNRSLLSCATEYEIAERGHRARQKGSCCTYFAIGEARRQLGKFLQLRQGSPGHAPHNNQLETPQPRSRVAPLRAA